MHNLKFLLGGFLLLLFPVITFAGTADLLDKSGNKIATIADGLLKDPDGKVLYTIAGNTIYEGADTAGNLLYTVDDGDVMGKENIQVHGNDGKVAMTIWYGQFSYGKYSGHQNFTYIMGFFTAPKDGAFKIKEKLLGPSLGEAHTNGLTGAEYVALFCVYMKKFDLDEHAKKRIEEYKAEQAAEAEAASNPSSSSSDPNNPTASEPGGVVYFTVQNKCNQDVEWAIIEDGGSTQYKKLGGYGDESISAFVGTRICVKAGNGYTTVATVSASLSQQTVYICQ